MSEANISALYAAFAKAQGAFLPIAKNRTVAIQTKSGRCYQFRYADLEAINAATRPALSANGLGTSQVIVGDTLITKLLHAEGGIIESTIPLPPATSFPDLKEYGAQITYIRRYTIGSILQVSADDDLDVNGLGLDDGGGAGGTPAEALLSTADQLRGAATSRELAQIMSSMDDRGRKNFLPLYNEMNSTLKARTSNGTA